MEEEPQEPEDGESMLEEEADNVASLRGPELNIELPPSSPSGLSHSDDDSLLTEEPGLPVADPPPTAPLRIKSPELSPTTPLVISWRPSQLGSIPALDDPATPSSSDHHLPPPSPIPRVTSPAQESALAQLEGRRLLMPLSPSAEALSPTTASFAAQSEIGPGSTPYVSPSGRPLTFLLIRTHRNPTLSRVHPVNLPSIKNETPRPFHLRTAQSYLASWLQQLLSTAWNGLELRFTFSQGSTSPDRMVRFKWISSSIQKEGVPLLLEDLCR